MRKLLILFLLVGLISCNSQNSTVVLKTLNYSDSTLIYLYNTDTEKVDTGYIENNELLFIVNNTKPTQLMLSTDYKKRKEFEIITIWKEKSSVEIIAEKGKLSEAKVTGSAIQHQMNLLKEKQKPYQIIADSIHTLYRNTPRNDSEKRGKLRSLRMSYEDSLKTVSLSYIKEHPDFYYSTVILNRLIHELAKDSLNKYYSMLSSQNQSNKYADEVRRYIKFSKNLKVGDRAVNFKLPNINGDSISLDSFKGKYVLLDFWSSNCGPCLMENPLLLKKYNQYKSEGFEIMGYCLDKNKESWKKTIEKYNINWTTVSDLKGTKGDIPLTYDLYMMPTYFMIDREGFIIAKLQGRRGLEEMIDSTFAGKLKLGKNEKNN